MADVEVNSEKSSSQVAFKASSIFVHYLKELKRRSLNKASVLLMCYSVPAFCCLFVLKTVALSLMDYPIHKSCFTVAPERESIYSKVQYVLRTLQTTVTYIAFPVMGWIAEVCVGRTKVMTFSIYSMWFGMVIFTLTYVIQLTTCGLTFNIVKYTGTGIGLVYLIMGTAGFFANLPAYVMEQMISEPSDKLRASVNWFTWSLFVGTTIHYFALPQDTHYGNRTSILIVSFIITFLCSTVVIMHQFFSKYFIKVGTMKQNPTKVIWKVVLYAFRKHHPKQRSAFSYWDKVMPSRFDIGKEKYGGPFSDEEVEDVKSFWRVFFVMCTLIGFYIPFGAISSDGLIYIKMFKDSADFLNSHILFALVSGVFTILIPLFEFIVIPCYPRLDYWMQNSIKGIGVSYILFFISLLLMIVLDIVGQYKENFKSECYLNHKLTYSVSFLWYLGPFLLFSFADALNFLFSVQFIMCQAPLRLCGVLIGLFWLLKAFGSNLAVMIKIPFDVGHFSQKLHLACSFWILLIHSVICIISIICYVIVTRRYQKRKKNVDFLGKEIVEEYYGRLMDQSDGEISYPPLLAKNMNYFNYEAAIQNKEFCIQ